MERVCIESPYGGDIALNVRYARACMRDCVKRGEAPLASHILYTQVGILDDSIPEERELGMRCGFEWNRWADRTVVYGDLGISNGMQAGMRDAVKRGRAIEHRKIGFGWINATIGPADAKARELFEKWWDRARFHSSKVQGNDKEYSWRAWRACAELVDFAQATPDHPNIEDVRTAISKLIAGAFKFASATNPDLLQEAERIMDSERTKILLAMGFNQQPANIST